MKAKSILLFAFAALGLWACGKDETVRVGEPGEKGIYKNNIDTAKNIAGGASEKEKQGEKDLNGGQ